MRTTPNGSLLVGHVTLGGAEGAYRAKVIHGVKRWRDGKGYITACNTFYAAFLGEWMRETETPVTCKACLKALAKESDE